MLRLISLPGNHLQLQGNDMKMGADIEKEKVGNKWDKCCESTIS